MTGDELRSLVKSHPFRPFRIVYRTGQVFEVPDPEYLWVPPSPGTNRFYLDDGEGHFEVLDSTWIVNISYPHDGHGARRQAG